jgi:hypothetical protein
MPFGFRITPDTLPSGILRALVQDRPAGFLWSFCSPGQRGITPAFGYGTPHSSTEGTLTPMTHALPSAHYEGILTPNDAFWSAAFWPTFRSRFFHAEKRGRSVPRIASRNGPSSEQIDLDLDVAARRFRIRTNFMRFLNERLGDFTIDARQADIKAVPQNN